MDGERQSSHGGRTGPHDYNLSRMSYRESSCACLKEWNQLPTNMAVFLMAFLHAFLPRTHVGMGQPAAPP